MADVGFNVLRLGPARNGLENVLAKSGSRLYKGNGKKSIKLMGAQRAWCALSGRSKWLEKGEFFQTPPQRDRGHGERFLEGPRPDRRQPRIPRRTQKPGGGILKKGGRALEEAESGRHALAATPFGFLLRGLRVEVSEKGSVGEPLCSGEPLHFSLDLSCFGMDLSCFGMYLSCFGMIFHVLAWLAACCDGFR